MQTKIQNSVSKEKIRAFIGVLKNVPWAIGERVFPFFVVMIFLAVFAGVVFFSRFVVLGQQQKPGTPNDLPVLQKRGLEDIVAIWEARLERLWAADSKNYPDIFSPQGR